MGERKRPGRFTIQFSQQDPQQRMVTEILKEQGRRKAQFITSAVLQYSQGKAFCESARSFHDFGQEQLEQVILSVMKRYPLLAASASESCNVSKSPEGELEEPPPSWEDASGGSALNAISNTLAAFRQNS